MLYSGQKSSEKGKKRAVSGAGKEKRVDKECRKGQSKKKSRIKPDSITRRIQAKANEIESGKKTLRFKWWLSHCECVEITHNTLQIYECNHREMAGNELKHGVIISAPYSQRSCSCSGPVRLQLSMLIYTSC